MDSSIKWIYSNGALLISGSGWMDNSYTSANIQPWRISGVASNITSVKVSEGVKLIGANSFRNLTNLVSVSLPNSLQQVSEYGFYNCSNLSDINFTSDIGFLGDYAFRCCSSLPSVKLKSFPTFCTNVFDNTNITLELTDTERPYISNNTTYAPTISSGKYIRTLASGKYGTIILPFVPDNVNDYKFYTLKSGDATNLVFTEIPSDDVQAGVPYLYKNADDGDIKTEMTKASSFTMTVNSTNPDPIGNWQLKGSFQEFSTINENYYVLSNNQFWNSTNTVTVNPFRAYLEYSGSGSAKMDIMIDGDEPTKIDFSQIEGMEHLSKEVYDLSGRRVQNPKRGLYIVNGRKVIISVY